MPPAEGLSPQVLAQIAALVLTPDFMLLIPRPNALFEALGYGNHLAVVLAALAQSPEAIAQYLDGDDLAARLEALLALEDFDGVGEGVAAILLIALEVDPSLAPEEVDHALAAELARVLGNEGLGDLDINFEVLASLLPHLAALTDGTAYGQGELSLDEAVALFESLLEGLSAEERDLLAQLLLGAAALDAGRIGADDQALNDRVANELLDTLIPLQAALGNVLGDIEAARAAIDSAIKKGVGAVSIILNIVAINPATAGGKIAASIILKEVSEFVTGQIQDRIAGELGEIPTARETAISVIDQTLPALAQNPDVQDTLAAEGAIDQVVPAGETPPNGPYVVTLDDGSHVVFDPDWVETLVNGVAGELDTQS